MLKDLFRKLDKLTIDNCLDYNEFRILYQRLNLKLTEDDYNRNILRVYSPSYPGGLDKRAFLNFWKGLIKLNKEPIVWRYLEKLGYDRDMYPVESRNFMLVLHSLKPVAVSVIENPGFDTLVNQIIINKEGKEIEKRPSQYRLI
jgi:hypothetical protein